MSGDAEQEYFSDGITEDIITELSRFRNLFVIARNSSFTYKGRAVDVKKVGRELGVDFVVEGSVRRLGGRIRITAQLINTANGSHVWAERYDRPFDEIFDLQDEVVTTIAATAEGRVASAVADHADTRRSANLAAYEAVLQARQLLATYQTEAAEPLLRKALIVDPNYAQAYAWLSWIEMIKFFYDLSTETISDAATWGKKAVAADQNDSQCHVSLAFAYLFQKKFDLADAESKRALEINPTDPLAVNVRAQWLSRAGFAEEALKNLEDVLRRDPFPPSWHWGNRATAFLCLERYEDAIAAINRKSRTFWWDHYMRGVCHYYLGNTVRAQAEIADMQKERPTVTITDILIAEPFRSAEDQQRLTVGLRGAGLPE
jgi:adenylate cyclase